MAGATFHGGSWLLVATGTNHLSFLLSFMSNHPALAVLFPWFLAVLVFFLALFVVAILCGVFGINADTFQGSTVWIPSSILLTLALLWLFGLITGGTVHRLLIWGLYGLAGMMVASLLLTSISLLLEWKSKRSKGLHGK